VNGPRLAERSHFLRPVRHDLSQADRDRRNAQKSTGPITEEGKQHSRGNAVRHGLTAETVIGTLEDVEDYQAFEAAIIADYDAQSAVERELVLRLASLLWRLRRATEIETGLFEIQAEHLSNAGRSHQVSLASREVVRALFGPGKSISSPDGLPACVRAEHSVDSAADLTQCFLNLANLPNFALDRLSRYEATLWRQVGQVLFTLDALERRKPHERRLRFPW
jgi:hypothetical protein